METIGVKTDIHIIGLGRLGSKLYESLLLSKQNNKQNNSNMGDVVGYGTKVEDKVDGLKTLRYTSAQRRVNPSSVEIKYEQYTFLDELAEKIINAGKKSREQGKGTIVFMANNYALDWMKLDGDTAPQLDQEGITRFQTTFYDEQNNSLLSLDDRFQAVWKREKEVYDRLKIHERTYATNLLATYVGIINNMPGDDQWKAENIEKITEMIHGNTDGKAKRLNIVDAYIAAQQLAAAMKQAEQYIDAFIIVSNPMDAFVNFYQRTSGFAPEKLWCPLDIDRIRVQKVMRDELTDKGITEVKREEIIKQIQAVGPHNAWNMAVYDQILGDLSSLFGDNKDKAIRWMEEKIIYSNQLAEDRLDRTGEMPDDFFPVAHDAIIDAITQGARERESTKVLQYSPDAGMHIGLMGRIRNYRVEQASWQEVLGETIEPVTREKLKQRDSALEELLKGMETEGLLPSGQEAQEERRAQFMRDIEATVSARQTSAGTAYTTRVANDANKEGALAEGAYLVATRYEKRGRDKPQLYFAFVQEAKGEQWFGIEKLVEIPHNQTPRAIIFDEQRVYYGHSGGIAVVDVETGYPNTVLNIKGDGIVSKRKKRPTGASSMIEDGDTILFTVPGKGIGCVNKKTRKKEQLSEAEEAKMWVYSSNEFVDCITRYKNGYVAISGDGIVRRKNIVWEKQILPGTEGSYIALEALAVEGEDIFFVAQEDGKYILGRYREGNGEENNSIARLAEIKKEKQQRNYALRDDYMERAKIAAQKGYVVACLYDGTMLFYDRTTGEAEVKSPISVQMTDKGTPQNTPINGIRAVHARENGCIITGNVTVLMQEHGKMIEIYGLYDDRNPATCLKEIKVCR